ncbi:MAG: dolichyl-phosphate-mannose--protein mannosyltransferase [Nocardioides sp.]
MSSTVTEGLSRTARGGKVPTAWQRARGPRSLEDPVLGWCAGIGVMLFALVLRLWDLGKPAEFSFDETYYAKDAWSMLHFGHGMDYVDDANDQILAGDTAGLWKDTPSMTVHPEVGKWLIAIGIKLFGMDPFGWRIASAVVGSLMILVMIRFVRRVSGSTFLGCLAGLLLALDGMHFVLSRLALLDIFLAFFTLAAVHCLVADRQQFRRRLGERVADQVTSGFGPVRGLLLRPWLIASGVCWGLALACKWTAIYPLAAFGLLYWVWCAGARRSFGVRWPVLRSALADGLTAFAQICLTALVVYVVSWTGWLINADTYEEHLSANRYQSWTGQGHCDGESYVVDNPDDSRHWATADEPDASGIGEVWQSLRSLAFYHRDLYVFHTHFLSCAEHTYQSLPRGWMLLNRPVGINAENGIQPGDQGCTAAAGSDCLRQVLLLGNPMIWWGGALAAIFALVMWIGARDWRFGVAVVGVLSTWLPWMQYDDRPIFSFYAIVTLPFLVLAITLAIGKLIGSGSRERRRTVGVVLAGSYVMLAFINFAWFWPIWTNQLLTHDQWLQRIWFTRWI